MVFTPAFIAHYFPEQDLLSTAFGKRGNVITISESQTQYFKRLIENIKQEPDLLGKQLLVYHLLLRIAKLSQWNTPKNGNPAHYVIQAISYLENHYNEKITAEQLAKQLFVGRTTFMTEFKKHVGITLGEYLTVCRLKNAIRFLVDGQTLENTAKQCGFSDSSGLIKAFKKRFHTTPYQYAKNKKEP